MCFSQYKFMVILFGLINILIMFMTLINSLLNTILEILVLAFLDGIHIFNYLQGTHLENWKSFLIHTMHAKVSKFEIFHWTFNLWVILNFDDIHMNSIEIKENMEWFYGKVAQVS